MAIVPLDEINTKVMIAIRISGMSRPNRCSAKTSLGLGQGTVVDMRAVMYDNRKQPKMNVSLSRKIHIMALPQETFLNVLWSDDQSAAIPRRPGGRGATGAACSSVVSAMSISSLGTAGRADARQESDPRPPSP